MNHNRQTRLNVDSKLVKFTTDFKNLKYSQDQRDGGTSGQPFIKKPLPEFAPTNIVANYKKVASGADVTAMFASIDETRIGRFLKTAKGQQFTKTQKTLQFQNPKTEVGAQLNAPDNTNRGFFGNLVRNILNGGAIEYTRVYNNGNMLLQIGKEGSGYHFDRPGDGPVTPYQSKYFYTVKNKDTDQNRLKLLYDSKIKSSGRISVYADNVNDYNNTGISRRSNMLFEYLGGPGASNDSSFTTIQRYDYTNTWEGFKFPTFATLTKNNNRVAGAALDPTITVVATVQSDLSRVSKLTQLLNRTVTNTVTPGTAYYTLPLPNGITERGSTEILIKRYTDDTFANDNPTTEDNRQVGTVATTNRAKAWSYKDILAANRSSNSTNGRLNIDNDFRAKIAGLPSGADYSGSTGEGFLDYRFGVGNPGSANINRANYSTVGYGTNNAGVDRISAMDIGEAYDATHKDVIKCVISSVETQQIADKLSTVMVPMVFRAYLTNITDNYTANYAEHTYVGRGDKFYTYTNADRKIGFELAIAAHSRAEMKPMYRKLNYLISQMYPGYSGFANDVGNGFMRAPMVKISLGDYLADQPGFLTSINVTIPEESPWEIKLDPTGKDKDMYELPHYLKLTVAFTPIHNFLPRRGFKSEKDGYITPAFITPNEAVNKTNTNLFNLG